MASTDLVEVTLGPAHVPAALDLVAEAGWNQTHRDWEMFLRAGSAFGLQTGAGRLIASALVLPFGPSFGWISMILVTADHQRQGIATRLVERAIAMLEDQGRAPVLDATPAGQVVYARMGFKPVLGLHRWQRAAAPPDPRNTATRPATPADAARILAIDRAAFGGERATILTDLLERKAPAFLSPQGDGYALCRAGRIATQLGPVVADHPAQGADLFTRVLAATEGPTFIDIPDHQSGIVSLATDAGFVRQRPFQRMIRGSADLGQPERVFAIAGPELG